MYSCTPIGLQTPYFLKSVLYIFSQACFIPISPPKQCTCLTHLYEYEISRGE